jgi:methylated-DNA-[protein]-cysteine S-methyltransferase
MTNGLNPVAIVIPCHRMIGSNGALTGYAGGLERKQWLLQHEGIDVVQLTKGFTHASVE